MRAFRRRAAARRDRLLRFICRRWLTLATLALAVFVALPLLAPVMMMQPGLRTPGRLIYALYSPFCHQFAFRSFFIGGEQPTWPRELAGLGRRQL